MEKKHHIIKGTQKMQIPRPLLTVGIKHASDNSEVGLGYACKGEK